MNSPFDDYISTDTAPLYKNEASDPEGNDPEILHLLWGDGVKILQQGGARTQVRARSRNRTGWVSNECLGGKSLMEFYYIDVGQGDGVLIKTPDFQHILIDGGWPRKSQDTGKNAADFVDWKFFQDYGMNQIELEAMICSHNDQDHYGGLWDILNPDQQQELDVSKVYVKNFYHAGLGWWKKGKKKWLGEFEPKKGETFFTQLMEDRADVEASLGGTGPQLAGEWAHFLRRVTEAKWKNNQPTTISRLSHLDEHLPGFTTKTDGKPAIKILAPVEFDIGGKKAIRRFPGGDSKNTNGNSIMLRVDFGRTRTILTGDLNKSSQTWLLKDYEGHTQEFECDVAKSCHHGSDDVS
jgi:beta-lactamase superfamily II metal-dependent hydrolase